MFQSTVLALVASALPLTLSATGQNLSDQPAHPAFAVEIKVDVSKPVAPFKPVHRFYGCDEPNYAYLPAGQRLLTELGKTSPSAPVYFRTHNLFTTGDGTPALKWGSTNVYTEDAAGNPVYDFTILDRIVDAYRAAKVKPYFQLGFMPKALSSQPEPYQHHWDPAQKYDAIYTGWAYPPTDYHKWSELCFQVTKHFVERYGAPEVESWYFQTWNEPNIGYWKGTPEEFFKLHDYAINGVKRALPTARVGGPDTAGPGGEFMKKFLDHCLSGTNYATGTRGTPLDFVSFHAKGMPNHDHGHVQMGIARQLKNINDGFAAIAARPETRNLPIVIGESDPEGCAACQGPDLQYRNSTMYSSYTAASFARKIELADRHGVNFEGALTWAFEFEDHPIFAGFRVLASQDIDHAVINVFRFFSQLSGQRVQSHSTAAVSLDNILNSGVRSQPDVSVLATSDTDKTALLLWHYHDNDLPRPDASVTLTVKGLPAGQSSLLLTEHRIDQTHGNAYPLWRSMGSPASPTPDQRRQLIAAATNTITHGKVPLTITAGQATIQCTIPRQTVVLITLDRP